VSKTVLFFLERKWNSRPQEPNILFGNMLELVRKSPIKCIEDWLEKYGKVMGTTPVILIADVDLLKRIQVSDFHKFINRANLFRGGPDRSKNKKVKRVEGFTQHLVALRDKRWKEIRSIITPSFTASKMKLMAPIMNTAIDSLVANVDKKCASGESFDIYPMYQGLTMDVIGRTAFGIQTDSQNNPNDPLLRSISFRSLNTLWTWMNRIRLMLINKGTNPIKELIGSVKAVIAMRRKNKESGRPDLLQLMIDAEIDDLSKVTSDDLTAKDDTEVDEKEKKK
ncbi:cytochrome P450 3A29, partial [Caerostris extrusa]